MEVSGELHAQTALIVKKEPPVTYCTNRIQGRMGPTTGLKAVEEKENNFRYYREPNLDSSVVQSIV
jgi:hypothetical protein